MMRISPDSYMRIYTDFLTLPTVCQIAQKNYLKSWLAPEMTRYRGE